MDAEICGVLVGSNDDGCTTIDACIAGDNAARGAAHVTFTQDTWEHIYAIKDRDFPNKKMVGWYHSHPGFGVFLSHHDIFIHENFFKAPHQVAWVFDPHSDEEGCFGWSQGEVRRLQHFEVITHVPDTPPQPEPDAVPRPEPVLSTVVEDMPPQEIPQRKGVLGTWHRIPIRNKVKLLLVVAAVLIGIIAAEIILSTGLHESIRLPSINRVLESIRRPFRKLGRPRQADAGAGHHYDSVPIKSVPALMPETPPSAEPKQVQLQLRDSDTNTVGIPKPSPAAIVTNPLIEAALPVPHLEESNHGF
jgi:proteasome lid subunit RPN8/RPN11